MFYSIFFKFGQFGSILRPNPVYFWPKIELRNISKNNTTLRRKTPEINFYKLDFNLALFVFNIYINQNLNLSSLKILSNISEKKFRWHLKCHLIIFSGYYYYSTTLPLSTSTTTEKSPLTPFLPNGF